MNSEKKKTVNRTGLSNTLMWPVPTAVQRKIRPLTLLTFPVCFTFPGWSLPHLD